MASIFASNDSGSDGEGPPKQAYPKQNSVHLDAPRRRSRSRSPARGSVAGHPSAAQPSRGSSGKLLSIAAALSSLKAASAPAPAQTYQSDPYAAYSHTAQHYAPPAASARYSHSYQPVGQPYAAPYTAPYASRYATAAPHATGVYNGSATGHSQPPQLSLPYQPTAVGQRYASPGSKAPTLRPSVQPRHPPSAANAQQAAPSDPKKAAPVYQFSIGAGDQSALSAKKQPLKPQAGDLNKLGPPKNGAGTGPKRDVNTGLVFPYRESFNKDIRLKGGNPNMFKVERRCVVTGSSSGQKTLYMAQVVNTTMNNLVVGRTEGPVQGKRNAINIAFYNALRNPDATRGMFWQEKEQRKLQSMAGQHVLRYLAISHVMEKHAQLAPGEVQELLQGLLDERMISALHGRMLETEPDNPYCRCSAAHAGIKRSATCVYSWVWRKHAELQGDAKATWDATAIIWNRMPMLLRPIYARKNVAKLRQQEEAARAALGGEFEDADLQSAPYQQPKPVSSSTLAEDKQEEVKEAGGNVWKPIDEDFDFDEDTDVEDAVDVPEVEG